jgi:hypothetical protein
MSKMGLLIVAAGGLAAQTAGFQIQPAPDSRFELLVHKTGGLAGKKHVFVFDRYRGQFDGTKMEFALESNSMRCLDDWNPAKGKIAEIVKVAQTDLLDAGRHPEIRFVSAEISDRGNGSYEAKGDLTIRGVSKPVTVNLVRNGDILEGSAVIRHSDYGLKQQTALLGAIGTRNEMDVSFRLRISAP